MNDTVDKLVIFLAKRDGIDKLVKTFQYVSKLVNWHVETTYPDLATRAKQWEVASGLSRKAFRTGRSLTGFNALRRSPGTTPGFRLLAVLANSGEMVYFFFDHFLWLARIGVIDAKYAKRMSFISAFAVTLLPHLTHSLDGTKNLPHFATDTSFADQMAEGGNASRYVKLTKDQAPREDIKPGELNQPIDVPQLTGRKCHECGQPLPESFEPPADEPWTTGIFGCAEDKDSCWRGLFCPCVLFGQNVESLRDDDTPWSTPCVCHAIFIEGGIAVAAATAAFHGIDPRTSFLICEGLLFSWWMCGIYTGLVRQSLQKKYHLKNSPCDPCMVHCCLHWCALCQEHREMKSRLSDNVAMQMTIVNPPPVQEMSAAADNRESGPSSANGVNQTNLEMQAL